MRFPAFFVILLLLLCPSACVSSTTEKSPEVAQTVNTEFHKGNASISPKPSSQITNSEANQVQAGEQPPCPKEFQTQIVKYRDLPKDVKVKIDKTAKNMFSEFSLLISSSTDNPSAEKLRCQTYYDYSTRKYKNGTEVGEKQNVGWRFIKVGEHFRYVPPYTPKT